MPKRISLLLMLFFGNLNLLQLTAQNQVTIDSLRLYIENAKDSSSKVMPLLIIASGIGASDVKLAQQYAGRALKLASVSGNDILLTQTYLALSVLYFSLSDLKNAIEYAHQARILAEKIDSKPEIAKAYSDLGMAYYSLGDKKKCSEYFFSSLKIYEKLNNKVGISKSLTSIGILYYDQADYEKAKEYYTRAIEIDKSIDDQEGIGANLNNLANVMFKQEKYSQALLYFKQAYLISVKINNVSYQGSFLLNMGKTYLKLKQYSEALNNCNEGLKIFEVLNDYYKIANACMRISEINLEMKDYDLALGNAQKSLAICQQFGLKDFIYQSTRLIHHIYLAKNDIVNAYKYISLESQWKDSLDISEKEKTLASLELQYHFEKKEQQELADRQRRTFLTYALFSFMSLIIIIILLILNQLRLKAKKTKLENTSLEKELVFNKKEILLNVMSLMKQNEMLSDISKRIVHYQETAQHDETREVLRRVGKDLLKSSEEESLKEFSVRFKEVNKDFYDALLNKFPDLTPNEMKLCAFLRLNMTTKEICDLTGQRLNSLETARYRLRHKLGISNSEINLVTFLSQI